MSPFVVETRALARRVEVTDAEIVVELSDERRISAPLAWFPRLLEASPTERNRWELIGDGEGVHWPEIDEDSSVAGLLAGRPSASLPRRQLLGSRSGRVPPL